jgi:protein tyrosine/serine phosphatase
VIAEDYAVTRVGIEPQRVFLTGMIKKWKPDLDETTPGFNDFLSIKSSYMLAFLEAVRKEYGGIEGYLQSRLKFSQEDIEKIQEKIKA